MVFTFKDELVDAVEFEKTMDEKTLFYVNYLKTKLKKAVDETHTLQAELKKVTGKDYSK